MVYSIFSWLPRYLFPDITKPSIEEYPIQVTDNIIVPKYALDILATKTFIKPAEYHIIYQWIRIGLQTDDERIVSEALRAIEESAHPKLADEGVDKFPPAQSTF
ncbi:hypothetical protein TWF718_007327 [Orbilia javanica]|uniref:Uncharacterized protein n=1 Tax=Orbilia javanica TaxID=47235 RepID=A0AAN8MYY1_9PEZI